MSTSCILSVKCHFWTKSFNAFIWHGQIALVLGMCKIIFVCTCECMCVEVCMCVYVCFKVVKSVILINLICMVKLMFLFFSYCTLLNDCFASDVCDREHGVKYVTVEKREKHISLISHSVTGNSNTFRIQFKDPVACFEMCTFYSTFVVIATEVGA